MTLEECKNNIGRKVIYIPFDAKDRGLQETGVITSVNNKYCFVRYGSDINSKATNPNDLML